MATTDHTLDPAVAVDVVFGLATVGVVYAHRATLGVAVYRMAGWLLAVPAFLFFARRVGVLSYVCYRALSWSGTYPKFGTLCTLLLASHLVSKPQHNMTHALRMWACAS